MTRVLLAALFGMAVGVVAGAALGLHAEQLPTEETTAVAEEVGISAWDLQGAVNTTGLEPREYLYEVGELARSTPPAPVCDWPICGALGQRIWCIEGIESAHGAAMYNPVSWRGEHAQGWLGWLPSTAARWGAQIGNRWSEWMAAVAMLQRGAGSQFFGVAAGIC